MDSNVLVIVILGSGVFFGFIAWMASISSKNDRGKKLNFGNSTNYFVKARKRITSRK